MFDDILQMVKEHLGNNPQVNNAIPDQHTDAVHNEIANHIATNLSSSQGIGGIASGLLQNLESKVAEGGPVVSAIEGGLVNSLTSKFGLPPSVTGAIAGALPGLLQKLANKQKAG
ncbi:MAG: hypothetical protein JST09_18360 [Bacteroidetes bacterium]|nr:hypothetical protein [Bacteroidota bacterium]